MGAPHPRPECPAWPSLSLQRVPRGLPRGLPAAEGTEGSAPSKPGLGSPQIPPSRCSDNYLFMNACSQDFIQVSGFQPVF